MAHDMLEQLSHDNVPPVPAGFDRGVHERVNHSLLVTHLVDFFCRALPYAWLHLAAGLAGVLEWTLAGPPRERQSPESK